ncbi:MAG: YIP1 family protein [Verrucomicrobia bacterium]|nr:YIP1 family protein [Verrucomicrobiota bacterium]
MKIWINRAGQNLGTFTLEEVQRGLNQGQFVPTDLGWQEGMATWKVLAEFSGLQMPSILAQPPTPGPVSPASPYVPPPLGLVTSAPVEGLEDGPAWERRRELGIFKALMQTWKEVLFNPTVSFARMKPSGGFASPLLFNVTMIVIYAFFTTVYQLIFFGVFAATSMHNDSNSLSGSISAGLPPIVNIGVMLVTIPLLVGLTFVNAGIVHGCLALFKGTSKSYEATYRVVCYSYSTWIFSIVPCAGGVVSSVWWVICTIIGLAKVHRTDVWRSAVAVLFPVFVCVGIVVVLYLAIIAAVVGSHYHANT